MRVKELIDLLQEKHPEAKVIIGWGGVEWGQMGDIDRVTDDQDMIHKYVVLRSRDVESAIKMYPG